MRLKKEAVLSFESNDDGLPKVVRDYRRRYRAISQVLDNDDAMLSAVHEDLKQLSEGGRTDAMVESNIHYPTDAWLLWDAWHIASRPLRRAREIDRLAAERYQTPGHTALPFFGMTFMPRTS